MRCAVSEVMIDERDTRGWCRRDKKEETPRGDTVMCAASGGVHHEARKKKHQGDDTAIQTVKR